MMLNIKRSLKWLAIILMGVAIVIVGYFVTLHELAVSGKYPVKRVQVVGHYQYIDNATLQLVLLPYVKQGLFALSEWNMAHDLEAIPAVKSVSIWRIWPDTLRVSITEREAIARWGQDQLLSRDGIIFTPVSKAMINANLPLLYGDPKYQKNILKLLKALSPLFKAQDMTVTGLGLSNNLDVNVQVNNQFWINLGHTDLEGRVNQFLQASHALLASNPGHQLVSVDLRYAYGFAVKWQ